jgi:hypothetical protein
MVHLYDAQVSQFLFLFMDLLTKVASLWNTGKLMIIR